MVGFEGTTNIGPVLEVTTCYLQSKYAVEIRIESLNEDTSHSWVRISHGLKKLATELSNKEGRRQRAGKPLRRSLKKIALKKRMFLACASRSKAEAKTTKLHLCLLIHKKLYLSVKDLGLMLSQDLIRISLSQCENDWVLFFVMVIYLEKKMERDWKDDLRYECEHSQYWSDDVWKSKDGRRRRATRKDINIVLTRQGQENSSWPSSARSFRTQSNWSCTSRDNVLIPNNFFEYICPHGMRYQFTLHHKFKIDRREDKNFGPGKTDGIVLRLWIQWIRNTKDPYEIDSTAPRPLHGTSRIRGKRHQDSVLGPIYNLLNGEDRSFYQTESNAIFLYDTLPAYCIQKVVVMEIWRKIIYEKVYMSTSTSPKDFLQKWLDERVGFNSCWKP